MPRSRIEMETSCVMNPVEPNAIIWTANPAHQRKLERMGFSPREKTFNGEGRWYDIPKTCVSFRKPKKLNLTDEQRKAIGSRLKGLRKM